MVIALYWSYSSGEFNNWSGVSVYPFVCPSRSISIEIRVYIVTSFEIIFHFNISHASQQNIIRNACDLTGFSLNYVLIDFKYKVAMSVIWWPFVHSFSMCFD